VTRQRVCPASKTLARDKRGFLLGDIRFVAVATIARDGKESHLGTVVSNNRGANKAPHQYSDVQIRHAFSFWLIVLFYCPALSRTGFKICVRRHFREDEEPPIEEKSPNSHFPSDKCLSIPSLAESRARLPESNRMEV
jgi:hypothetical protein